MLLERTVFQLDIGHVTPGRARALGQMGYQQWLDGLPGGASYVGEARRALALARPLKSNSPALAEFCRLLEASLAKPANPLALITPTAGRRGGAKARRASL